MKLNGPEAELLPATWNCTLVFAGVVAVHEIVVHVGLNPAAGLASLTAEIRLPEAGKVADDIYVRKLKSLVTSAAHVPPLSPDEK